MAISDRPEAASGEKPSPIRIAPVTATGVPKPEAPSKKAPNENAMSRSCSRRSWVTLPMVVCSVSNAPLNFTIIQASWFMEVWLSPALGFDYPNAAARIYGPGTNPISWVSFRDVAEMCALAVRAQAADRRTIEFGGPEALSPLEVVARFEKIGGRPFQLEHVPKQTLRAQFEEAADPMQKTFAGLMLGYLYGDAMDMAPVVEQFGIKLTSVDEYARSVLGGRKTA